MKTVSAAETVAMIRDGAALMIGGFKTVDSPEDMVWIPGGSFHMRRHQGCDRQGAMVHAFVTGFWMDRTPVTVRRFSEFVAATGYVTRAESAVDDAGPGSLVFIGAESRSAISGRCWAFSREANWRGSRCVGVPDQPFDDNRPAVHVTYQDAEAYAAWVHKALPTEAEWEFAAQGGYGLEGLTNGIWEWTVDWYLPGAAGDLPKSCCVPECPGNETSSDSTKPFHSAKAVEGRLLLPQPGLRSAIRRSNACSTDRCGSRSHRISLREGRGGAGLIHEVHRPAGHAKSRVAAVSGHTECPNRQVSGFDQHVLDCIADEFGSRSYRQLAHCRGAMGLDGLDTQIEDLAHALVAMTL